MPEIIKIKDLPYITNVEELRDDDRFVATRLTNGERQTVGIELATLVAVLTNYILGTGETRGMLFGIDEPTNNLGHDGDNYIRLFEAEARVRGMYVKYEGQWYQFNFKRR